ncbi:MAG: hypothetical protein P1U65_07515 [Minwuia sp.]|nr:hypothetical protein [Minwuia sp.]
MACNRVVTLCVLLLALVACSPMNPADPPPAAKPVFRADLAGFCLRNPDTTGCENFKQGVSR